MFTGLVSEPPVAPVVLVLVDPDNAPLAKPAANPKL